MKQIIKEFGPYHMRLIQVDDIDKYYSQAITQADDEANYFTGTSGSFTLEQISGYINRVVTDDTRYDFLIFEEETIVGEIVLSEVAEDTAHYRVCIYKKENFSKKIGSRATIELLKFAFDDLKLSTIDLEVFPFNERGIGLYKKLGFKITDKIVDEEAKEPYKDIIIMVLKAEDFRREL